MRETQVQFLGGEDPWRRKWQPTLVLLPGKSHGRRSLTGYSPRGRKESDTTEWLHFSKPRLFLLSPKVFSLHLCLLCCPACGIVGYRLPNWFQTLPRWAAPGVFPLFQWWVRAKSLQSCPTLCNPMDCGPPGSPVHGILQARILQWVVLSFSRESCRPTDPTQASHIAGRLFTDWATREITKEEQKTKEHQGPAKERLTQARVDENSRSGWLSRSGNREGGVFAEPGDWASAVARLAAMVPGSVLSAAGGGSDFPSGSPVSASFSSYPACSAAAEAAVRQRLSLPLRHLHLGLSPGWRRWRGGGQ